MHLRHVGAVTAGLLVAAILVSAPLATTGSASGKIAFTRYSQDGYTGSVFVIDPDGSGLRKLTHPASGVSDINPDWSPNGKKVAFSRCASRCEVRIIKAAGGKSRRLGPACQSKQPPKCEDREAAAWSPNGKTIAMGRAWGALSHNTIEYTGVAVINVKTGHRRQLLTSKPFWGDIKNPSWSSNGRQLVVEIDDSGWKASGPGKGHRALFVVNRDGSGLRQLTDYQLDAGDPSWSADGTEILFRSEPGNNDEATGGNLYTIHPDGTALQQLTHSDASSYVLSGSFSPDSRSIVFAEGFSGGLRDLIIMGADGSGVHALTHSGVWESGPDWGS